MIIRHLDTGREYGIPQEKCKIDNFVVCQNHLICVPTKTYISFFRPESAETAFYCVQEALREGYTEIFIEEFPDISFGMEKR